MADTKINGTIHWTPAIRELFAQDDRPRLQPGETGWWPVWGASVRDVRPGDLVMIGWRDDDGSHGVDTYEVAAPHTYGDLRDSYRPSFTDPAGAIFGIGALQPIKLFRHGTGNVLSDYVR